MAFMLRAADSDDLGAVVELMNRAFRGSGEDAGWNSEAGFIKGDRTSEDSLTTELNEQSDSYLLLVDGEAGSASYGCIAGCVLLREMGGGKWYLGSLTVDSRLQNSGLGRRLLEAAELWAMGRGARTMQMTVVNIRETLIAWYERRGYRLTGETRPFPYGDDRFGRPMRNDLAFVLLEKELPVP